MRRFASASAAALLFVSGGVVGHLWTKNSLSVQAKMPVLNSRGEEPLVAASASSKKESGKPESTRKAASPEGALASLKPENQKPPAKLSFDEIDERAISELLYEPVVPVEDVNEQRNKDGSRDIFGKTADGKDAFRHFNPRDELTREGWTTKDGEDMYRSYYESGGVKQATWSGADKAMASVGMTQSGLYEHRYERSSDGSSISINYDDAGQVNEVWHTDQEGKTTQIR